MEHQKYDIIETKKNNRTFYGLKIIDASSKTYSYKYIAECKDDVVQLVTRMSADYISPVHFRDIISDFITEKAAEKIDLLNA